MGDELTNFLEIFAYSLIIITMPILIAAAAMSIRSNVAKVRERVGEERWEQIDATVRAGVRFAEQSGILQSLFGPDKKQLAVEYVERKLREAGIDNVDVDQIATLIENEVRHQFQNPTSVQDTIEARQQLINKAIEAAILSAEQSGLSGVIENVGQAKKEHAVRFVQDYLKQFGITLPEQVVTGLIEAQLLKMLMAARANAAGQAAPSTPTAPAQQPVPPAAEASAAG